MRSVLFFAALAVSACEWADKEGTGENQITTCTVEETEEGVFEMDCPDGTTVSWRNGEDGANGTDGEDGEDGTSCVLVPLEHGCVSIRCGNNLSEPICPGADGTSCTAMEDGVQCVEIECEDGSSVRVCPPTGPAIECEFNSDCHDQSLCTTDRCEAGDCRHTVVSCASGQVCNPSSGNCVPSGGGYVDQDGDGFTSEGDCDDLDDDVFPGADEVCSDGEDNDCDGVTDENCPITCGDWGAWITIPGPASACGASGQPACPRWKVGRDLTGSNPEEQFQVITSSAGLTWGHTSARSVWAWPDPWGTPIPSGLTCVNRCGQVAQMVVESRSVGGGGFVAICRTDAPAR